MDQAVIGYDPIEAIADWMLRSRSGGFEELMDLGCFIDRGGFWNSQQSLVDRFTRAVDFKNRECEERVSNILCLAVMGYTDREIAELVGIHYSNVCRCLKKATGERNKTPEKCRCIDIGEKQGINNANTQTGERKGYDRVTPMSVSRLTRLYMAEGLPEHKAEAQAIRIRREMKRLERREQRLWTRVQKFEVHSADNTDAGLT